jgi:hypothetical protein
MALPAKQRTKLWCTMALKILVQVFRKGKTRKNMQNKMIYQFYHGDAAAGIPSRVKMLVCGKHIYAKLDKEKVDLVTGDDIDCLTPTNLSQANSIAPTKIISFGVISQYWCWREMCLPRTLPW